MAESKPLLIELGTEELPPAALNDLAQHFADVIQAELLAADLIDAASTMQVFNTPRRLAVYFSRVASAQPQQQIERRGPAVAAALDADGQPTRALQGFMRSCGIDDMSVLQKLASDKGEWFVYHATEPGKTLTELLPAMVQTSIKRLPVPRVMRWGDNDYGFVRPVHWLVVLHGTEVLPMALMGLHSDRYSRGHRFHHPQSVEIASADSWQQSLEAAHVMVDPAQRRARIQQQVDAVTDMGTPRLSAALLNELTSLNEWPVAIACHFDAEFLDVPPEALITTMESNQKFVPVFAADGALTRQFVGVANIESSQPDAIRQGYERVIRPRFADAKFFFEKDLKISLAEQQSALRDVTYQQDLGSIWDKTCRVGELSRLIANRVDVDPQLAMRAASLAKCDLVSLMVGEFPELQGTMGRYYAQHAGEDPEVALALDEFYMPRHAGDPIARNKIGQVLAVAERLDTLCGIFAVGLHPTGNKDPYALRRAALSIVRTLIEGELDLDTEGMLREALEFIPDEALQAGFTRRHKKTKPENLPAFSAHKERQQLYRSLQAFIDERLHSYYVDKGISHGVFAAVSAVNPRSLTDFAQRLNAVNQFSSMAQAQSLVAANKRVSNLLRKQQEDDASDLPEWDPALLAEPAEQALAQALTAAANDSAAAMDKHDYTQALSHLAPLKEPVDRFFDDVMVMVDDAALRRNRLALLAALREAFMAIADIGKI